MDKTLSKLTKRQRENIQINKIRNENVDITTDTDEIERIIRSYFENLCYTKLESLKEMHSFLGKYHLPKLNPVEISKLNRPITSKEIKVVIKILPTKKKKLRTRGFQLRILQDFQRRNNNNTAQTIPHNRNRRNISKLFMRLQLP